ncbi:MAG: hypothetical protein WBC45_03620, partial [Atribacterota bacterium]
MTAGEAKRLGITFTGDSTDLDETIDDIKKKLADLKKEFEDYKNTVEKGNKEVSDSVEEAEGAFAKLEKGVKSLGLVGKVMAGIFAIGVVQGLMQAGRAVVNFAKEIVTRGAEMSEAMFTFEVSIRALQRIGLETTIADWSKEIDQLKKKFPFFSKKEFIEATTLAALMTREFGFTTEQIASLTEQAVVLAQVTGKDLTESIRGVTFAIGSGYFESLQRAGINISRQIIAEEALKRGYEGSYTALNQNIRAMLTYEIIQNNISAIAEDAARKVDTYAGQVDILIASWEDLKNLFGTFVGESDTVLEFMESLNEILKSITSTYETIAKMDIDMFAGFKVLGTFLGADNIIKGIEDITTSLQWFTNVLDGLLTVAEAFNLDTVINALSRAAGLGNIINLDKSLGDAPIGGEDETSREYDLGRRFETEEDYNEFVDAFVEANEKIDEINKEGVEKRLDILEKYDQDSVALAEKNSDKMADIAQDLQDKLDDIETNRLQRIEDANSDYQYRLAEAARQAAFRKEEAERRYREREINAEKRFQEKMRQLRENFLLNLEDAVRERDALQIIRLTRQYNLRKTQMEREGALSGADRKNAFQEELRQIEQQRLERQRQLAIENQRRLAEIELQARREIDKANELARRKEEEEAMRADEAALARADRLEEDLLALDGAIQDRINKVISGLQQEFDLTAEEMGKLAALYASAYGPGSQYDVAIGYAIGRAHQLTLAWIRLRQVMGMGGRAPGVMGVQTGGQAEG